MNWNIPKFIEKRLLSDYPEYGTAPKEISSKEEKTILAKLVLAQQVEFFLIGEDVDFRSFEEIKPKLLHGFKKLLPPLIFLAFVFAYGLLEFILRASEDEKLKPKVIIAVFSLFQFYCPPAEISMYFWQSENMIKFVDQYMKTCPTISGSSRKFYRSLAIKRNLFKFCIRFGAIWNIIVHFFEGSSCSATDLRFVCGLFLPLWFPVETNYFPVREIIVLIVIVIAWKVIILVIHQTIDAYVMAELFDYKSQRLIKLMQKTSLSRYQNLDFVKRKFRDIVKFHQDLRLCLGLLRHIIGGISAPAITIFVPTAACLTTAFAKDFNSAYLLEFFILVAGCHLFFYSTQKIVDLGDIIREAAYSMDWYEMDKAMNKEYIVFLMKVQRPHELHSILFNLERPMFLSVMRSVYSFFMLMYQIN